MNIDVFNATVNPGLAISSLIIFGIAAIAAVILCISVTALFIFNGGKWAEAFAGFSLPVFFLGAIASLILSNVGTHQLGNNFGEWVHEHYSYKISESQAQELYSGDAVVLDVDGTPKKITLETYKNGKILIMDGNALPQKEE